MPGETNPILLGVEDPTTKVDTLPQHRPGTRVQVGDIFYVYGQCTVTGGVGLGDFCFFNAANQASEKAATGSNNYARQVVVPQVAVPENSYAWFVTHGSGFTGNALASCAAAAEIYTSATAGYVDDGVTNNYLILGLRATASRGGTDGTTTFAAPFPMSIAGIDDTGAG